MPEQTSRSYKQFYWVFFLLFPLMMQGFKAEEIAPKDIPIVLPIEGQLRVGERAIQLEIARNPTTISRGLTYRDRIPDDRGMLYQSAFTTQTYFTGKGNQFDTDLIFLDGNRIVDLQRVAACQEDKCLQHRTNRIYDSVVEVKAGVVNQLGLTVGMNIKLDILPNNPLNGR